MVSCNSDVKLEEAQEIAKRFIVKEGFNLDDFEVIADSNNSEWKEFIENNPTVLEEEIMKGMSLERKKYWAIHFVQRELSPGGEPWVFINAENGEIIGFFSEE